MNVTVKNTSRSMLRLAIIGTSALLPGEELTTTEFCIKRAQPGSLMRTGRLEVRNAETGELFPPEWARPNSRVGEYDQSKNKMHWPDPRRDIKETIVQHDGHLDFDDAPKAPVIGKSN